MGSQKILLGHETSDVAAHCWSRLHAPQYESEKVITASLAPCAPGARNAYPASWCTAFVGNEALQHKLWERLSKALNRQSQGHFLTCPGGVRDCELHVDCLPHPKRHRNKCHLNGAEKGEWGPNCMDNADHHCHAQEKGDGGFLFCSEKNECRWKSLGYKRKVLGL
mmetsp:Transcript_24784/g.45450  ORF Transcript_24784/g.45450 Transcript_24784/m.45450 type:complete len:166 (+) Transcript_24784:106-603(+)